jgi:AhpD family alkylhydroperoxidase
MVRALAQSPHSLDGYWRLNHALAEGKLPAKLREQIALVVAHTNQCEYSLAQHVAQANQLGLSAEEIRRSRRARTRDAKTNKALSFARELAARSRDASIQSLSEAGYDQAEIVEIVANVSLNVFENHFNDVPQLAVGS